MDKVKLKTIYKIIYPNGKIYIGKDSTGTFRYFGSPNSKLLEDDFTEKQKKDFTIRRQILWQSKDNMTESELIKKENEFIKRYQSNNPRIGYNRHPQWKE